MAESEFAAQRRADLAVRAAGFGRLDDAAEDVVLRVAGAPLTWPSCSASMAVKLAGICWVMNTGTRTAPFARLKIRSKAGGPPVELAIANADARAAPNAAGAGLAVCTLRRRRPCALIFNRNSSRKAGAALATLASALGT